MLGAILARMKPASNVPSFDLDHTKVRAPYVRFAGEQQGPLGDTVSKYDLRLTQPNATPLDTATVHTLEHLLAGYLRDVLGPSMIDVSPMGCRTGFYLTVFGKANEEHILNAFTLALQHIAAFTGDIPGVSEERCGNYIDHSRAGAVAIAEQVLAQGIVIQNTVLLRE